MGGSSINFDVRLETALRKEGRNWLAWCLPLDIMTQANSRKEATEALKEAVQLWFESCIERNVLSEALEEAGFNKATSGEQLPDDANFVKVTESPKRIPAKRIRAFAGAHDYIEVSVPAYIAARQPTMKSRASR